jgi:hypothetical protein
MLKYRAANALFQFVSLLNADLTSSLVTSGYVPYIVRLKLTIVPYRANLPYDFFARIAFFSSSNCPQAYLRSNPCLEHLPQVIPLLVSDDIERASNSAAAENVRQLAGALNILAPYAQASGNVNSVRDILQSLSGQNYDSTLSVGRDANNTLMVRIGAAYQTETDRSLLAKLKGDPTPRSLIGQNYDVATIVLVPKEYFTVAATQDLRLSVVLNSDFRSTQDGSTLPGRGPDTTVRDFEAALTNAVRGVESSDWFKSYWLPASPAEKFDAATSLVSFVQAGTFDQFIERFCEIETMRAPSGTPPPILRAPTPADPYTLQACENNTVNQRHAQVLWTRLAALLPDTQYASTEISLPFLRELVIPQQIVTLLDDGKSSMQAQIRTNATSLVANPVATAGLVGQRPDNTQFFTPVLSKSSSFDPTTGILTFQFPSAVASGISGIKGDGWSSIQITPPVCNLDQGPARLPPAYSACTHLDLLPIGSAVPQSQNPLNLAVAYQIAAGSGGPVPGFAFSSGANQIVALGNNGTLIVNFPSWTSAEDTAVITVTGASIVSSSTGALANGQVTITKPGASVVLQLVNVWPGVPVTAQAEGKAAGTSTGKTSISFTVLSSPNKQMVQ